MLILWKLCIGLMEFEEIDDEFLVKNPKRIGSMVTDNIISDKDMFESSWELEKFSSNL